MADPIEKEEAEEIVAARRKKVITVGVIAALATMTLGWFIYKALFSSQFVTYREDKHQITINYPRGWRVAPGYEGTIVTFLAPREDGLDTFQESLNIAVKDLSMSPMTLPEYTKLATKQMAAVFKNNIEVMESTPISFAGQNAHRYVVKAAPPQDAILTVIWFIKDNQAYTITYFGQTLRYDQYKPKFDEMVNSFTIPL